MRRRSFFFSPHPLQVVLEALALGIVLWLSLFVLRAYFPSSSISPVFWIQASFTFLVGPTCMLWCAVRLPRSTGKWQWYLFTMFLILVLGVVLNGGAQAFSVVLLHDTMIPLGRYSTVVWFVLAPCMDYIVFMLCRIGVRIWIFWDQLRRKQLIWGLAHAHVMLLALGAGVLILLIDILLFSRSSDLYFVPTRILPVTVFLVIMSVCTLIAVVPPFALFSYVAMRRTVERLKILAVATSILRSGNYAVRVPVAGEDEVAQLQSDFNAMATELQRAMHELQGERDTVARLLDERRELLANVSHELRTPVATLRGYLETTLMHWEGISQSSLYHDLRVMEDETVHLQGLVEDLFTLSRAEVGKLVLHCVPADIEMIVRRIVDATAPLVWRSSKIEMVADVPAKLPPALVDVMRMEQILQNLLHNGARHTAPGGIVAVMVTMEAAMLVIQVRDTGEGIAPDDLPHIWRRFYQSKNSRMGGGSGLGLALVKEWVETMNGTVAVESILGQGSCFTVRVPAANVSHPVPAALAR